MQAPRHLPQTENHPSGRRRSDAGNREWRSRHCTDRTPQKRFCPSAGGKPGCAVPGGQHHTAYPSTLVLDKLSAIAVDKGVQPVIVCTKGDLAEAEFLRSAYEKSTLPFIRIDYETGAGLDEVKQWITGRLCAFCGNSGVGKSTLLNALLPDVERETGAISQKLGRGRHTTREVTIFEAFGGRIADTPGFASLEANRAGFIPKENLEHAFPEFGPYLGECQFTGCSHRAEKGCAVRAALAEGKLSQTRYDSYCAMYDEVKDVKDWQRPKV